MADEQGSELRVPRRGEVIDKHREGGGQIAAVFPIHYPRALLRAFGLLPVEVWGPPGREVALGETHLQNYTCSIVRAGLSFLASGGLGVADVVLVPHGCDSLQGLGSALLDFVRPQQPVLTLYLPRGEGPEAETFLTEEIGALDRRLQELNGVRPSDDELMAAVVREEAADALLAQLWQQRGRLPLSNRDFYRLCRTREYLPAEDFAALAQQWLDGAKDDAISGVPVVLSGVVPEPMEVLDALSQAGALVAADDTICLGRRIYPAGRSSKPRRRMAERLLGGPPDSTRGRPVEARARHLEKLVTDAGARAVLFFHVKFCEPEQFYLPLLRKSLDRLGVRSAVVEVELSDPLPRQAVTQIEALLETVS